MLLNMNFSHLSVEGYTAFILAIIFTIISIASFIFFAKHKNSNKIINILTAIVFPALSIFCWVYLLAIVLGANLAVSLGTSFGATCGYALIAALIAWLINKKIEEKNNVEKINEETENSETEETEEPIFGPLLMVEDKKEDIVEENVVEEEPTIETKTEVEEEW